MSDRRVAVQQGGIRSLEAMPSGWGLMMQQADVLVNAPPRGQLSFMARDDELVQGVC